MRELKQRPTLKDELHYFENLWQSRSGGDSGEHSPKTWDRRAVSWIEELERDGEANISFERVRVVSGYLRARGLLGAGDAVVDLGCGPGLFVLEFAKTAKHSTGIDFSRRFIDYGIQKAKSKRIENVSFVHQDMFGLDVEKAGLFEAYDLVFTSILPAMTKEGTLDKVMQLSRGMCFNVSFVNVKDNIVQSVIRDVFDGNASIKRDGFGFYSLFNLLLLSGYYPETNYYFFEKHKEINKNEKELLDMAEDVAFNLRLKSDEDIQKIYKYLQETEEKERVTVQCFGSILWDKRIRNEVR